MDSEKLKSIMLKEKDALEKLLSLLEEQHKLLLGNNVFELEGMVSEIQEANKVIAELEVERRKETAGKEMSEFVKESKNLELENIYRNIKRLLSELQLQKDTNEALIKQGLGFSTRILNILTPDRNTKPIIHTENLEDRGERMSGLFNTFNIAKRGLFVQQRAIEVTSHNIANANTEGYSRQRVEIQTTRPFECLL